MEGHIAKLNSQARRTEQTTHLALQPAFYTISTRLSG
jgi:hypothetical protein